MNKLTINDLDFRGKRVFIRVDFNVPLKDGVVTDDTRIRETLPTLKLAIEKGGRLVLASHLGRPKGGPEAKYSLRRKPKTHQKRRTPGSFRAPRSPQRGTESEIFAQASRKKTRPVWRNASCLRLRSRFPF